MRSLYSCCNSFELTGVTPQISLDQVFYLTIIRKEGCSGLRHCTETQRNCILCNANVFSASIGFREWWTKNIVQRCLWLQSYSSVMCNFKRRHFNLTDGHLIINNNVYWFLSQKHMAPLHLKPPSLTNEASPLPDDPARFFFHLARKYACPYSQIHPAEPCKCLLLLAWQDAGWWEMCLLVRGPFQQLWNCPGNCLNTSCLLIATDGVGNVSLSVRWKACPEWKYYDLQATAGFSLFP